MNPGRRIAGACLALAAAGILAAEAPPTYEVRFRDFELYVVENATLDARRSVTIASELPSNLAKVVWLVEEGSQVEPGAPVVRFDPAPFEEELAQARRDLADARAALAQAEAELQIHIRKAREDRDRVENQLETSRVRLKNLREAEHPLRLITARNELHSARIDRDDAEDELEAQREMLAGGFGNAKSVKEAEMLHREKANAFDLAEQQLRLMETVILPSELTQAELELKAKTDELAHTEQLNLHAMAKQQAILSRLRNKIEELEGATGKAEAMLERTEVVAPVSGFVIYKEISLGNERRKVQVGDSVWNRHGFIVIPDMSEMIARIDVREIDIGKIAVGQAVSLRPEAHPDLMLGGTVENVGTMGARQTADGENLFTVKVAIAEPDVRLRPGMRASAAVLVGRFEQVLTLPVEAVFYEGSTPVCYVWRNNRSESRVVELGPGDGRDVIIESGLEAGERVLLSHPAMAAAH